MARSPCWTSIRSDCFSVACCHVRVHLRKSIIEDGLAEVNITLRAQVEDGGQVPKWPRLSPPPFAELARSSQSNLNIRSISRPYTRHRQTGSSFVIRVHPSAIASNVREQTIQVGAPLSESESWSRPDSARTCWRNAYIPEGKKQSTTMPATGAYHLPAH